MDLEAQIKEENKMTKFSVPDQKQFLDFYGEDDRTTVCMEEMAELAKTVSKYKRYVLTPAKYRNDDRYTASQIREKAVDDLADAVICLELLKEIFAIDDEELALEIHKKYQRNLDILEKQKK
jgi:NTP pyrophosphatase (non-canonical NTP hydrolase)